MEGLKKLKIVKDPLDFLNLRELVPKDVQASISVLRKNLEQVVRPYVNDIVENALMPQKLVEEFKSMNIIGTEKAGFGCRALSNLEKSLILYELSRIDAGVATFYVVHVCLAMRSIELLGSDEQKERYLKPMGKLEKIGCFGLTEPTHGSDASALISTATPVKGGFLINGRKRWIGNASHSDYIITFARDTTDRKIKSFVVATNSPGVKVTVITRKLALRPVQNCDIEFVNVFVPESDRLANGDGFIEGVNRVLSSSRMFVSWVAIGIMAGSYESALLYSSSRLQFQAPLTSYQLTQEKLVRILGHFSASFLQGWRIMTMDKCEVPQSALVKSQVTLMGREVTKLAREIIGGNGILIDNYVMKAMLDMEAIYTYEGTYDINILATGREITGVASIRPNYKL